MKAPDKIYICPSELAGIDYEEEWLDRPFGDSIEYVRIDAFIEEAVGWLKLFLNNSVCIKDVGERAKRVIVDDFRKAMKG